MENLIHSRRRFLTGVITLLAAPAIVRASSLMPVKSWVEPAALPLPPLKAEGTTVALDPAPLPGYGETFEAYRKRFQDWLVRRTGWDKDAAPVFVMPDERGVALSWQGNEFRFDMDIYEEPPAQSWYFRSGA